ncbi:hypothetical protein A4X06_0g6695 [Tilletia controversa]|uniref:Uncharacterized protein n=1 Tax=Tilletia controversa TaxID=13291 RepID=A0A8X7MN74_9BASI|nr:hypothetical protein A4X06_0g6695 [Tilletia controversa]
MNQRPDCRSSSSGWTHTHKEQTRRQGESRHQLSLASRDRQWHQTFAAGSRRAGRPTTHKAEDGGDDDPPEDRPKTLLRPHAAPIRKKWEVLLDQQKERLSVQKTTKSIAETTAAATSTSSEQVKTHHHPDEPVADTIRDSTISKPPLPTPALVFTLPKAKTKSITTRRFNPNTIVVKPTANRPDQIPGDLHFELWTPAAQPSSSSRSITQDAQVRQVILSSFAVGTKSSYSTAVAQWHNFCDRHNIEEDRRSPANPELVELWIAEAAGIKSGGYLKDWVCGLKALHTLNGVPWLIDDDRMRLVKRGAKYTQPPPPSTTHSPDDGGMASSGPPGGQA